MLIGLKLWSRNIALIPEAVRLAKKGACQFIELYVEPGSFEETCSPWMGSGLEFVLHAPHFHHGFNLSEPNLRESNRKMFDEVIRFRDQLQSITVVVHGGTKGALDETIQQLSGMGLNGLLIENKPVIGLDGSRCVGTSPEEITRIMKECNTGFCLDIAHAIAWGAHEGIPPLEAIQAFLKLSPAMFHLCDGDSTLVADRHLSLGQGDFPIADILNLLGDAATITLETPKNLEAGLKDFEADVAWLKTKLRTPDAITTSR